MFQFEYARQQVTAVWKMATNDAGWRDQLDTSVDGVFRSAWAVLYAVLFSLAMSFFAWQSMSIADDTPKFPLFYAGKYIFIGVQTSEILIAWLANLVALTLIARNLGADGRIAQIIVGFNWAQPIVLFIQAMAYGVLAFSQSSTLGGIVFLPALVLQVLIVWGVLRRGFERDTGTTVAIIGGILLVDILVTSAIRRLAIGLLEMTGSL
ncbi:MAG: hypothetical protein AAF986_09260 [Pseudomonadota bacterium]